MLPHKKAPEQSLEKTMNQQELLLDQTTKNKLIEFLFELETDSKINHFLTPIEWCNDTALLNDYNKIVEKPMDIYTIKHKIKNNFYINILEVKADLDLITQNCMNYNSEGSEIFTEANYMKNYCEVLFELFFPERFPEKDLGVNVRKARRTSLNSEREETSVTEKSEESQDKENQLSLFEKLRVLTNLQTLQAKQCNPKFFYDLAEEYSKKDFFCSSERNKELLIMLNLDLLSKEDETKLLAAVAEQMEVIKNREESPGERKGEAEHKKEGGTGQSSEKYPDSEDLFQHSENYLRITEDVGKGKEKTGKEGKASLDVANDEKLAQNIFNEEFKRVTRSNRKK
mmetsp:Transcript_3866/g.3956  ORF Transcript_3866/g.3956 Transcript_3866/m.3956 type:complete len:342 (-) Transcript_3866:45-1070(-)